MRYQEPCSTSVGTWQGSGCGHGQRQLAHGTASGSRTPLTTHPHPDAVSARRSPCPHTRNSLTVRKLITKGTYLTRERQIASWREVDSCFWRSSHQTARTTHTSRRAGRGRAGAHLRTCNAPLEVSAQHGHRTQAPPRSLVPSCAANHRWVSFSAWARGCV